MSRNLCRLDCYICQAPVTMTGTPYRLPDDHIHCAGLVVCDAECSACEARYTAWLGGGSAPPRDPYRGDAGFYDLSFRSTFNDEPGTEDVPNRDRTESYHMVTVDGRVTHLKNLSGD